MNPMLDFILAIITLLSGAGWITERRKRKAESEKVELDKCEMWNVKLQCKRVFMSRSFVAGLFAVQ